MWKWAKTVMQHASGSRQGYFSWRVRPDGTLMDPNPAPDGEEWIVMALFFASARWGNGTGIYDYKSEALAILEAMLNKAEQSDNDTTITNMFDKSEKQIVFVPLGDASRFTDPSYHLPHFYELWTRWSGNHFWADAAIVSRQFLKKMAHPETGLFPDYAGFDGSPVNLFWTGRHNDFRFDAWRVAMNIAVDHLWFATDDWAVAQSNRMLNFFYKEGLKTYGNQYTLNGKRLSNDHSPGLTAMNAAAALASTNEKRVEFVREFWETPIPDGIYRYYDGLLYMLGLLQVNGNFRIYEPADSNNK
jgi:oligosaccharide reducing-end xylanase